MKNQILKEFIIEIIANQLSNKESMIKELNEVLSIKEVDGKLNCSCKLMFQLDKEIITKLIS